MKLFATCMRDVADIDRNTPMHHFTTFEIPVALQVCRGRLSNSGSRASRKNRRVIRF